jgi:hypothetical protein
MLPVSSWPPGPPGASLSPFGNPRHVCVGSCGFVIPTGAWIVNTTSNSVVMFFPKKDPWVGVSQTPGTGKIPPSGPPPPSCKPPRFQKHDVVLEEWRAWQRKTGRTDPPIRPLAGRRPPNWFGWTFDPSAPRTTLVQPYSGGTVLADGQNVVISGGGWATITQAYSV